MCSDQKICSYILTSNKFMRHILISDYLKHAKCLDDASKTEEAKEQYAYVEAALEDLNDKPPEKKLPTACW